MIVVADSTGVDPNGTDHPIYTNEETSVPFSSRFYLSFGGTDRLVSDGDLVS